MGLNQKKNMKTSMLVFLMIVLFTSIISVVFMGEKRYKNLSRNLKKQDITTSLNIKPETVVTEQKDDTTKNIKIDWKNKLWSSMGDSITAQNLWQPTVVLELGLINKNSSIAATSIADVGDTATSMCRDERINSLDLSSDLITVMGGTNDWFRDVPLGTIKDSSMKTFYGAVNTMVKKLKTRFPNKQIVLMTTPVGKYPNKKGWTNIYGSKNNLGLTTSDYGKAIMEVGKLNNIAVADIYGNAGWDDKNISDYTSDEGDGVHILPNEVGAKKIAHILIDTLKGIELKQ